MSTIERVLKTEVSDDLKTVRVLALGIDQRLWLNELDLEACTWAGWREVNPPPLPGQEPPAVRRKKALARQKARAAKRKPRKMKRSRKAKNKRGGGVPGKAERSLPKVNGEITKECLQELYVEKGKPQADCARALGVAIPTFNALLKKFGIRPRKRGRPSTVASSPATIAAPKVRTFKEMSPEEQQKMRELYERRGPTWKTENTELQP